MKKIIRLFTIGVVSMFILSGCGPSGDNKGINQNTEDEINLEGTVNITGSTSVEKILYDMMDEFTAYNPDVTINYTGTGSSAGITDTLNFANDIGVSSRELKESEKNSDLKEVVFAHDGIAIVVHPDNPVTDISLEDLVKIYNGEIRDWSSLGGNAGTIIVVSREAASGTRNAFEELIKLEDEGGLTLSTTIVEGNGNIQSSVAGNKNAIGYVSFAFIDESVKTVTIDGGAPTPEEAKAGNYSLSRPFLMVYMESKLSETGRAFIDFAISEEGQEFVKEHGGIGVN